MVSVRRDGQQVSTDAAGERSFTVTDKRPVTWAVAVSNRAGATSDEIMVRPVTFGSAASFITSGMEAAGGLAPVLAFGFAALFNYPAGYWLASSLTILLVVSVVTWVHLEKA